MNGSCSVGASQERRSQMSQAQFQEDESGDSACASASAMPREDGAAGGAGAAGYAGASSSGAAASGLLNRSRSINRQRLVAHSTAMESIQAESEPIDEEDDVP